MNVGMVMLHALRLSDGPGGRPRADQCIEASMRELVSDAAITGAALVRHLEDVRFACLRALRQLLRALDAERIVIGCISPDGARLHEELAWAQGLAPCGESERVMSCAPFRDELQRWLDSTLPAACLGIDPYSAARHETSCDHLLLVRGEGVAEGGGLAVIAAQLRSPVALDLAEAQAVSLLIAEYYRRRSGFSR